MIDLLIHEIMKFIFSLLLMTWHLGFALPTLVIKEIGVSSLVHLILPFRGSYLCLRDITVISPVSNLLMKLVPFIWIK
jgi:hypothetical protein